MKLNEVNFFKGYLRSLSESIHTRGCKCDECSEISQDDGLKNKIAPGQKYDLDGNEVKVHKIFGEVNSFNAKVVYSESDNPNQKLELSLNKFARLANLIESIQENDTPEHVEITQEKPGHPNLVHDQDEDLNEGSQDAWEDLWKNYILAKRAGDEEKAKEYKQKMDEFDQQLDKENMDESEIAVFTKDDNLNEPEENLAETSLEDEFGSSQDAQSSAEEVGSHSAKMWMDDNQSFEPSDLDLKSAFDAWAGSAQAEDIISELGEQGAYAFFEIGWMSEVETASSQG